MKNKVLFILQTPPPVHGSSIIGKYIIESDLINLEFNCRYLNLGLSRNINEIGTQNIKKLFRYFHLIFKLNYYLLFFKPNLTYVAITAKGKGFFKDSFILFFLKIYNTKIIYHFHNKGIKIYQDKFIYNLFYKFFFHNTKLILTTKYLYYDIEKYFSRKSIFICQNGIPNLAKIYSKVNSNYPNILFLSNLIKSKGLFNLIDALDLLSKKNIQFYCSIVGGEGDINALDLDSYIKNKNLNKKINYIGSLYGDEKFQILRNTDIFVHPTLEDCFPLVLIEALQFGLPIISTYEGGIPDIVENGVNGFLVQKNNVNELATKIQDLILNENLRVSFGKKSSQFFNDKFTLQKFEKKLYNILSENI